MATRRLVGIDLGIASAHTVRVLDEAGEVVAKRKAWPTVESLSELEAAALAGCPEGTRLEVVMEPTGPAWLPVAVFFDARGHVVHRVSSAKAADLRRFLSRHTKTNGIDADTLARLALVDPAGLRPLVLAGAEAASLDRRVRACDRLTRQASEHKVRIRDLVRQVMPMTPLGADIGAADLAVLERYADPNALVGAGAKRLTTLISKASNNHQGADRAAEWLAAAEASIELYAAHPAVAYGDLADEIATEIRLLRAVQSELAAHAARREDAYQQVDPAELARSLPGVAVIGGPVLTAAMGDPARFANAKAFRSYTGLVPRASETGDTDRKGQPMSKAGPALLRTSLIRAADTARKQDPQLARLYYVQMVERGKDHLGALCVVAASLAERLWVVMARQSPYVICDTDGRPVNAEEAKTIIAQRWTVTPEVRARRRSRKMGKAPAVSRGERNRGPRGRLGERLWLPWTEEVVMTRGRGPALLETERQRIARWLVAGLTLVEVMALSGRGQSSIERVWAACGGFARPARKPRPDALRFAEREEISRGLAAGRSLRAIARCLGRSPSTISREVDKNGGRDRYRAEAAERRADEAARRPKPTKLATNPDLCGVVQEWLVELWSPEQVAARLRVEFVDDPEMWVSHETIYKALFIQGRGELRRELASSLRTGRACRVPRARVDGRKGTAKIAGMVSISERPAEVEDRAVPGHWEGDLIVGKNGKSAVATLVERHTRYVMLAELAHGRSAPAVRDALVTLVQRLPVELVKTLTWDQGTEMADHAGFSIDTGVEVFFCDPHSPWQRGSNENTNGLLRQYMPKGTDLSVHTQDDLDRFAASLNNRPRQTLGWLKPSEKLAELLQ